MGDRTTRNTTRITPAAATRSNKPDRGQKPKISIALEHRTRHENGCPRSLAFSDLGKHEPHRVPTSIQHENGCPRSLAFRDLGKHEPHRVQTSIQHKNGCPRSLAFRDLGKHEPNRVQTSIQHENGCPRSLAFRDLGKHEPHRVQTSIQHENRWVRYGTNRSAAGPDLRISDSTNPYHPPARLKALLRINSRPSLL
jgi:hypothetical protein